MHIVTTAEWDRFLERFPNAHLLQTSAWGNFKARFGWQVERVVVGKCGAQVLFRRLPGGFTLAYVPKGPVGPDWPSLWPALDQLCRKNRAVLLKVEPDASQPATGEEAARLAAQFPGFRAGGDPVQPRRTVLVSLAGGPEDWLSRMKQKTRYNVRLAEKKAVVVRSSQDLNIFYTLMQATGSRDGFGIHSQAYFQSVYDLFAPLGMCELLTAEYEGKPLAGLMVFARGTRAWYFYGASNEEERNRMPTYLLQFEAMRWAKARGCEVYDLWGIPDEEEEVLEANFSAHSDGLWGVYRFKRGFGGVLERSAGAWDRPYLPLVYPLYRWYSHRRHEAG